jgi:hypothetical protein
MPGERDPGRCDRGNNGRGGCRRDVGDFALFEGHESRGGLTKAQGRGRRRERHVLDGLDEILDVWGSARAPDGYGGGDGGCGRHDAVQFARCVCS